MALADILTKLKNQRNAIVTAINGKGGTLGTDATLADCATAINGISTGGGGVEFYKCSALVDAVEGTPGGDTLTLHMVRTTDSSDTKDYTFTVEDASKTGDARTWISDDNMRLKKDNGVWVIQIASMSSTVQTSEGSYTNPWEVTMFMSSPDKAYKYNNTWTVSEGTEGTPATWSGYKLIPGSSNYYALESTATTGLSYSSIVPEVGKIYSADARMILEDYFHFDYGMTVKTLVNKSASNPAWSSGDCGGDGNFNTDGWYVLTSSQSFYVMGDSYMTGENYFGRYNSMTLSFKFRYPAGSVGDGGVVARLDKSYSWMQLNMNSAGKFSIERYGNIIYDATPTDNTPLADLSPDTDYKFTFVFGADTFNVYLNGTKIYTAKSKNATDKPSYLYLHTNGGYPASTATYWYKDVYLFTRCLTEAEIATL